MRNRLTAFARYQIALADEWMAQGKGPGEVSDELEVSPLTLAHLYRLAKRPDRARVFEEADRRRKGVKPWAAARRDAAERNRSLGRQRYAEFKADVQDSLALGFPLEVALADAGSTPAAAERRADRWGDHEFARRIRSIPRQLAG